MYILYIINHIINIYNFIIIHIFGYFVNFFMLLF